MGLIYMIGALVLVQWISISCGSMMNKCMKVLVNGEFHMACSMLDSNHVRPCLVKTQQDADTLNGAKIIADGMQVPRNHICAARKEMWDADCISLHVRPNPQQTWQWTEWHMSSDTMIRNFVITEGSVDYTCPYEERYIKPVFTDCLTAYDSGLHESGIYPISPDGITEMQVYCEQELDGGGWTVFQARKDGSIDFYKDWNSYKQGFGELMGEFWLGNTNIHLLTKHHDQQLKIELISADGELKYAMYSHFSIDDEAAKFRLDVSGYSGGSPPGDAMPHHQGHKFSTRDQDNDRSSISCAEEGQGGWWYNACNSANLNGLYGSSTFNRGLNWQTWKGNHGSMKATRMMMRRKP